MPLDLSQDSAGCDTKRKASMGRLGVNLNKTSDFLVQTLLGTYKGLNILRGKDPGDSGVLKAFVIDLLKKH